MRIPKRFQDLIHRRAGSIGDYGWNLVSTATTQGTTLVAALILTRLLTVESFGRYVVGQTTVVALGSVFGLGLGLAANALLARSAAVPHRAAGIHRFCVTVVILSGLLAGCTVAISSEWLATHLFDDASLRPVIVMAGLAIPFAAVVNYQMGALAGMALFRGLARTAIAAAAVLLLGVSIGARVGGVVGALAALLVSLVIRCIINEAVLRVGAPSLLSQPDSSFRETWSEIRSFVIPLTLSGFTAMPAVWLATAILTSHADTRAVGIFSSAFLIKSLVTFVPLQFGAVLLSRLSALAAAGDVRAWRRMHTRVLLSGVGIAIILALPLTLLANHVTAVFGPSYREGAAVLRWLMLCGVVEAAATLSYYAFPSRGELWRAALAYTLPKDLLLVGTAIPFVATWGAVGLALAHTTSWVYGMLALSLLNRFERRLPDDHAARVASTTGSGESKGV